MKKGLLICIAIALISTLKANAFDLSFLNGFLGTTPKQQTATTVQNETLNTLKTINEQTAEIDKTVQNNFLSIVSLLSTKKETNTIKSELNSILTDTTKTDAERTEMLNNLLITYVSSMAGNTTPFKKLSVSQKIQLVKEITSIEQSGQKYAVLARQALASSASSVFKASTSTTGTTAEDIAAIITQTNQTAGLIKEKASNTMSLANQLMAVAQTAGITK